MTEWTIGLIVRPSKTKGWEIEVPELDGSVFAAVWGDKWGAWEQAWKYAEDLYASIEP